MRKQERKGKTANRKEIARNHVDPQDVTNVTDKSSKILEEIRPDISPEKVARINKDIEQSISKIEESGDILGMDLHAGAKNHIEGNEKIKKEMEKLKKELES